jgi:uncharacterized protein (TIGR02246 family)
MIVRKVVIGTLLAVSLGIAQAASPPVSLAAKPAGAGKLIADNQSDETAVRSQISNLTSALAKADVKGVLSLWTEDCSFTDEDGGQTKGKAQMQKRFETLFSNEGRQLVQLQPDSVRKLADNVAIAEGTVHRSDGASSATPVTRFSLLFLKQNGNWLISTGNEVPLVAQPSSNYLKDLSWIIGDWSAEKDGATVKMTAEWAANESFIHLKYLIKKPNEPEQTDIQVIGWDPRSDQLVSWHFDSNGGFGYGNWSKKGPQWLVDSTAVTHTGSTARAVNIITMNSANSFSWQSVNRSVDGETVGDTAPLEVKRVSK